MKLSDLLPGQSGIITKVKGRGAFRRRLIEMGFIQGKKVEVITKAPFKDPTEYKVMDYEVSLRRSEAELIDVITQEEVGKTTSNRNQPLTLDNHRLQTVAQEQSKIINVVLVGNPNSGKTSLFNAASGTHERVGNYGGVTVNAKKGKFKYKGYIFHIVDLPGTYSLTAYSPEEIYVRKQLIESTPDIIINVVAASNLERNLYLTTQLIDMDAEVIIALNMYDELEKSGAQFDYETLAGMIGYPIVPTQAKKHTGIDKLLDKAIEVYEGKNTIYRHIHINYGEEIETGIKSLNELISKDNRIGLDTSRRYLSIRLLEYDPLTEEFIKQFPNSDKILKERDRHAQHIKDDYREYAETAFTDARYGFIDGALKQTFQPGEKDSLKMTHVIDHIVTHKLWGYPIFFLFMLIVFQGTFLLGQYPMNWIEWCVNSLNTLIGNQMSEGPLKDLLTNGIIGGVGSVIVFLPNIVILYLFISLMEDTGYMARAAFIMDKFMQKIGLHGKSFIPLVMGLGCNVPAIMSTRIIESRNTRLITMLINPLISCSARLPVYLLLIGTFFPKHGGSILLGLYFTGFVLSILMSFVFKKFLIRGEDLPFVMELPPYRLPTVKSMIRHMWDKTSQYLKKMGGIILVASVVIWFMEYFPQNKQQNEYYNDQIAQLTENKANEENILNLLYKKNEEQKRHSYIGQIGQFIEPVMSPLGFDWKISASLLSGMAAKEIVVSTLGILYAGAEDNELLLKERLQSESYPDGTPILTPLVALSLSLFTLIYFPCIATIAAIKNESGSWKWTFFTMIYTTALAWIVSFVVYRIGLLFV